MKRELFENVKVIPGGLSAAIDRTGFLSAVLGVSAQAEDTLKIKAEHSDTENGEFTEIDDQFIGITGALEDVAVGEGQTVNICIDLLGCKRYIKLSVEGSAEGQALSSAVALGDPATAPV